MKDALATLFVILIAVVILVAGYYLGIVIAVLGAILMGLGIVALIVMFIIYAIWDAFFNKENHD